MSGDAAKINRDIQRLKSEIQQKRLQLRKVYLTENDMTPNGRALLRQNIEERNQYIGEIQVIIGRITQMILPSGSIVKAREDWIKKKEEMEALIHSLEGAQNSDLIILQQTY